MEPMLQRSRGSFKLDGYTVEAELNSLAVTYLQVPRLSTYLIGGYKSVHDWDRINEIQSPRVLAVGNQ